MAWVDFRKTLDMTLHQWILDVLRAIKALLQAQRAVSSLIPKWTTSIHLATHNRPAKIHITLKRDLFQGDSLSLLLFCLSVAPLSLALKYRGGGCQTTLLNHLLFMDNLKLYESNELRLVETLRMVVAAAGEVGMSLGMVKCAVVHMQ